MKGIESPKCLWKHRESESPEWPSGPRLWVGQAVLRAAAGMKMDIAGPTGRWVWGDSVRSGLAGGPEPPEHPPRKTSHVEERKNFK